MGFFPSQSRLPEPVKTQRQKQPVLTRMPSDPRLPPTLLPPAPPPDTSFGACQGLASPSYGWPSPLSLLEGQRAWGEQAPDSPEILNLIFLPVSCNETWICSTIWVNSYSMSTFTHQLGKGDNSEAEGSDGSRAVFAALQTNTPLTLPVSPHGEAIRQAAVNCSWKHLL